MRIRRIGGGAGPVTELACFVAWLAVAGQTTPAPVPLESPILLTQVSSQTHVPLPLRDPAAFMRADMLEGARLLLVSPGGETRVLSEGFDSAGDADVSFDARRVLFAGKRTSTSRWRIWETGLDGSGLRAVSPEHLDARSPIHVSTLFTLDSPEPWFTTVFVVQERTLNELGYASASSLYNIQLDGTELRRLTFNPNHDFDPFQMWDGRVIYCAERHPHQPGAAPGGVGLHALHIEGADMEFYGGGQGKRIQQMPCATGPGLVVFVESDQPAGDGAGQLAGLEESRPHRTYRRLTDDPAFVYRDPSPLEGGRLLVSRRATTGDADWGVFSFDTSDGRCLPLFDSPAHHDLQAVRVAPRGSPDGHSTVVETTSDTGLFYGLDCYLTDEAMAAHSRPGMVKRVRWIEGVTLAGPLPIPAAGCGPFVARRLVGEAPVEVDGSFNVEVPADTPLLLQTLDEQGMALATCGWIWVKPKEKRGCIGCHEDPELIPENEHALALRRPSNRLILPPADRRALAFREHIAPLIRRHCATAECHGGADHRLPLPLTAAAPTEAELERAFIRLMAPLMDRDSAAPGTLPPGKYVDPGRARTSWLIWQLSGRNTSRPWDGAPAAASGQRDISWMPPKGKATPLSQESLRTFIQWIDLGAQYAAPTGPGDPKRQSTP